MSRLLTGRFALGVIAAIGCASANASSISNPSFELPVVTGVDRINVSAGNFFVGSSGWQSTNLAGNNSGNAIYSNNTNSWVVPADGNQIVALNNGALGGIQQVFATTPGVLYSLTFSYSAIADGSATVQSASYEVDNGATPINAVGSPLTGASGTASVDITGFGNLAFPAYQTITVPFTATGATSTIRILSDSIPPTGNAYGPVVDNVTLTALTPEPSAFILGGLGLAGLFIAARRRRV